jgi:16S rRNA (adenine1518-N6/adenine1519-N6)-dimethyltransferase
MTARTARGAHRRAPRSGPAPRKALGQHFLRDSGILRDIVESLRVPDAGVVLEVGAGTGELTGALLDAGHEVVAVEIEPRLVAHLERRFAGRSGLRVVVGDARWVDLRTLVPPGRPFVVAGNLPYFAANPILRHLLEGEPRPEELVVMVQREVARRIAAPAGKLSILGIAVQVYAEPELLFDVPPEAFDPPPQVHSTVLRLIVRKPPLVPAERRDAFFDLVTRTFKNPRKHLHNALSRGVSLPEGGARAALLHAGIDPMRRPETLSIAEWLTLLDVTGEATADA